jgi:hypothetical protein
MSRLSNEEQKIEAERRREMTAAIQSLCAQREFLVFIHGFLSDLGLLENGGSGPAVFATNALVSAHESGKLASGKLIIAALIAEVPEFYINLLQEDLNATRRRSSRLANLGDPGGDDPDSD